MKDRVIFETRPGTYALILKTVQYSKCLIGSLGYLHIRPGFYIYTGSAFGPGGLKARLAHHLKRSANPRWHIDYLRQQANIYEIWYTYDSQKREHEWADRFYALSSAEIPFPGFGSSDCRCPSHLFYFAAVPSFGSFQALFPDPHSLIADPLH